MRDTVPPGTAPAPHPAIRRATEADIPAMARIVADWLATAPWNTGNPSRETLETSFTDALPLREIWVEGDPVAGYLSIDSGRSLVRALYAAHPGGGTGKRLLDHVKAGRSTLGLRTHTPNHAAHRFYAREGFEIVERDLHGEDGVTELRLEWTA